MSVSIPLNHLENLKLGDFDKVNILLVDDEPRNLLTLKRVLAPLDENLMMAESGKEALKLILKNQFALILLDINMPDIDGYQVAELVRKRKETRDTPIIFITAFDFGSDGVFRGYDKGAVDFLIKPIQPKILVSKVRVFVELHRKRLELSRQREIAIAELCKNRELNQANKLLQRMKEEAEQFASIASHDLQTPLRHIGNYIEVLKDELGIAASVEQREAIEIISAGANRMKTLINDLLAISRIGPQSVELAPVHLGTLLQSILETMEDEIEEAGASVTIGSLPTVFADEGKMRLVFQNLISNAIKYRSDQRACEIVISGGEDPRCFQVCVKDNGIGICEEHFSRIFEIFQRLHRNNEFSGTGIGLAICKKIITLHGGEIWLDSRLGMGSEFFVKLPKRAPLDRICLEQ